MIERGSKKRRKADSLCSNLLTPSGITRLVILKVETGEVIANVSASSIFGLGSEAFPFTPEKVAEVARRRRKIPKTVEIAQEGSTGTLALPSLPIVSLSSCF
jgi:hypothetical protein